MTVFEAVGNMHVHTPYSDGTDYHTEIAAAAQRAKLDFLIVTDHNILIRGVEGYYGDEANGYVLLLTGEEIHDRYRLPQVNHCLVYGVPEEVCHLASDPQQLIDHVQHAHGLSFLAHPFDTDIPWLHPNHDGIRIPWVDWQVQRYTGLEIWNYMSTWKATLPSVRKGLNSIFRPEETMVSPRRATLNHWDHLLSQGQRVVGIGNSDAHGTYLHLGPITHRIYPYDFLFSCVNTHVLLDEPLRGNLQTDQTLIYAALRHGHCFIGYGLPGDPRGFRVTAHSESGSGMMGDSVQLGAGVTLQIRAPARGTIRVIRHGEIVCEEASSDTVTYFVRQPGAYRVEVWREYRQQMRCWILSNPVYVTA